MEGTAEHGQMDEVAEVDLIVGKLGEIRQKYMQCAENLADQLDVLQKEDVERAKKNEQTMEQLENMTIDLYAARGFLLSIRSRKFF